MLSIQALAKYQAAILRFYGCNLKDLRLKAENSVRIKQIKNIFEYIKSIFTSPYFKYIKELFLFLLIT